MSAVDWVLLPKEALQVGDVVSAEPGGMPLYRVVRIEQDRAWLEDEGRSAITAAPLGRLVWKAAFH